MRSERKPACGESQLPAVKARESGNGAAALEAFGRRILRRERGAETILDAVAAMPDCPMVLANAAAYHLLADTRRGIDSALPLLDRATSYLASRTGREALFVTALDAMARGQLQRADSAFLALASEAPDDLAAGYIGHLHFLNHGRIQIMLAHARLLNQANRADPFALGMLGFALHEAGAVDAAWEAVLAADAADPGIAWVHHAAGHVFLTRRENERGSLWLERRAHHWQGCGSSMLTHNWWHTELLMLETGRIDAALAVYDRLIAAEAAVSISSFVNAASLLARIELRGGDAGPRWLPLAETARQRIGEHVLPFIDLHYALALARSGDEPACAALNRSAWHHAAKTAGRFRTSWMLAGLPLLDAVSAYAVGDRARARQSFERGLPHIQRLGGSNQQRALFHEFGVLSGSVPIRA